MASVPATPATTPPATPFKLSPRSPKKKKAAETPNLSVMHNEAVKGTKVERRPQSANDALPSVNTTPVGASPESMIGVPLQASSPNRSPSGIPLPVPAPAPAPAPQKDEGEGGDGDAQSLQSFQALLSPIHRSRGCHHFHLNTQKTLLTPNNLNGGPNIPIPLDRFLMDFDDDESSNANKSKIPIRKPDTLKQDLILSEKISAMGETDAKKLLAKVVKHNVDLRQELKMKEKKITAFKGQMLAILEWKAKQEMEGFSEGSSSDDPNSPDIISKSLTFSKTTRREREKKSEKIPIPTILESTESDDSSETDNQDQRGHPLPKKSKSGANLSTPNVAVMEEVFGIRRMSLSFIQDLASSIDVDQEAIKHRIKESCHLTNQLLLGGLSGWLAALFVKKFGKLALSAAGGGLLLLIYTTRKGYVNVNYDSIYQEISKICDTTIADDTLCPEDGGPPSKSLSRVGSRVTFKEDPLTSNDSLNKGKPAEQTTWEKVQAAKKWVSGHTYTVGGFVLTFVYNVV